MPADPDSGAGERHGAVGSSVETASEGDDHRPASGRLGELDRGLDGFRAGVRQEEPCRLARREVGEAPRQQLVQLQSGLVVEDVLLCVNDVRGLIGDRRGDARVGVPGARHPDPRGVVEETVALEGLDPGPLAALDDKVGVSAPDRWNPATQVEPRAGVGGHAGLLDSAHRSVRVGAAVSRCRPSQSWTAMKPNAIRKMRVPRTFTSGGTPSRLAP